MDMNRKNRSDLKNKKIKSLIVESLMLQFILVVALSVIVVSTAHAGAFLQKDPKYTSFTSVTLLNGESPKVVDRSRIEDVSDSSAPYDSYQHYNFQNGKSFGYYTGPDYYGATTNDPVYYLGTFEGNYGPETNLLPLLQYFMDDISLTSLGYEKIDDVFDGIGTERTFQGTNLTVTVTNTKTELDENDIEKVEALGGTWAFERGGSAETIDFYVVKGGNEYALYYVNPAQSSGTWTTAHLLDSGEQRGLSYLSVMKTADIDNPHVPEPATMLLFGFSLIGLAGMARRRNSKF